MTALEAYTIANGPAAGGEARVERAGAGLPQMLTKDY